MSDDKKEMSDEALNKVGRLLKSMTTCVLKGGKVAVLAPVKLSTAITKAAADRAKEKLDDGE